MGDIHLQHGQSSFFLAMDRNCSHPIWDVNQDLQMFSNTFNGLFFTIQFVAAQANEISRCLVFLSKPCKLPLEGQEPCHVLTSIA